ncbi:hypothetical protein BJX64DRAFT_225212 [Aspergillus heterothallicus]
MSAVPTLSQKDWVSQCFTDTAVKPCCKCGFRDQVMVVPVCDSLIFTTRVCATRPCRTAEPKPGGTSAFNGRQAQGFCISPGMLQLSFFLFQSRAPTAMVKDLSVLLIVV